MTDGSRDRWSSSSQIHTARTVLDNVLAARLPDGASVLEIGCGAGHLTAALAERGLHVDAVDVSEAMLDATAERIEQAGLAGQVTVAIADAHALPFESSRFELVVAVGVNPRLHPPRLAARDGAGAPPVRSAHPDR